MFKRGQISVEYLIVFGFIVFIVIGLLATAFFYAAGTRDRINSNELSSFANKITSSAESVYFAGEPSQVTITAHLPQGVQSIEIQQDNSQYFLVITSTASSGTSTQAFPSDVPIVNTNDFSLNEGLKRFEIKATGDIVEIREG